MDVQLFHNGDATPPRRPATRPDEPRRRRRWEPGEKEFEHTTRFYAHQLPDAAPAETHFRHSHWTARRNRIRALLGTAGASAHQLNRWDACGGQCTAEWSATLQKHRLRANYCKSRHCEPCMRAKANAIARNLRERLEQERNERRGRDPIGIRFITLTLKHTDAPLLDQLRRLKGAFKKLRSSSTWTNAVDGGAAMLEVKRCGRHWHPHLHVVAAGSFLDKRELSNAWHEATGDSFVVDVRALHDVTDACHYVTKYVTKGVDGSVWHTDDTAQEWISASRGVRACDTFGTWRGFKLTKRTSDVTDWKPVGTLLHILDAARDGQPWAIGVLLDLRPPGSTDEVLAYQTPPP